MAKFVEWSQELSVGIEEIDAQHRVLVDPINEMHEAIHDKVATGKTAIGFELMHFLKP